jgi:hypothetical protein
MVMSGHPTGHDFDDGPSLFAWVTLLSAVPEPAVREYVELLAKHGATSLSFAVDLVKVVGNTQQERIAWMLSQGVKMAHAPTLVRCIEKYDEYLQWTPPAPMHHQLPSAQMVESAQAEEEVAMLGVEAEKDGGSHLVSPTETLALYRVAAAGRDQTDAAFSGNVASPVMKSASPVRSVDGLLDSPPMPSEELVHCLGGMRDSMSLSDRPPSPAFIPDNGASHASLESPRVDIGHQPAGLGLVPSTRLSDPLVPLASTSAMVAQSESSSTTEEREEDAVRLREEGDMSSGRAVMGSVRTEEETQAPQDGSTTVDLRQPTSAGSWGGNGSYDVFLSGASDSEDGDLERPEVETEVDREEEPQGQVAGALEAAGQRLGLAVERQNVDALLSGLRSLQALLTTSQEQTDSGVVLRDEELAAIVLPLMRASYIHGETMQEAQTITVRRMWLQTVLHLCELVSTGKGAQWPNSRKRCWRSR